MGKVGQVLPLRTENITKIFIGVDLLKQIQLRLLKIPLYHLLEKLRQDSINLHLI